MIDSKTIEIIWTNEPANNPGYFARIHDGDDIEDRQLDATTQEAAIAEVDGWGQVTRCDAPRSV